MSGEYRGNTLPNGPEAIWSSIEMVTVAHLEQTLRGPITQETLRLRKLPNVLKTFDANTLNHIQYNMGTALARERTFALQTAGLVFHALQQEPTMATYALLFDVDQTIASRAVSRHAHILKVNDVLRPAVLPLMHALQRSDARIRFGLLSTRPPKGLHTPVLQPVLRLTSEAFLLSTDDTSIEATGTMQSTRITLNDADASMELRLKVHAAERLLVLDPELCIVNVDDHHYFNYVQSGDRYYARWLDSTSSFTMDFPPYAGP